MVTKPKTWVALYDMHYPKIDMPTFNAAMDFMRRNKIEGLILGGDQFDNECISHHTKGKPLLRLPGAYKRDEDGFREDILKPLEALYLNKQVWIVGNHDHWEHQLIEEQPELQGLIDRTESLKLRAKDWTIVELGHSYLLGKLHVIHGELLTGIGNQGGTFPAKKAVELYAANVLAGHTHSPQSFTKVCPVERVQKWMGHIAPILGRVNPGNLKSRPTAWLNGFVIIEFHKAGNFNCFPVIVSEGRFSYGGKVYSEAD